MVGRRSVKMCCGHAALRQRNVRTRSWSCTPSKRTTIAAMYPGTRHAAVWAWGARVMSGGVEGQNLRRVVERERLKLKTARVGEEPGSNIHERLADTDSDMVIVYQFGSGSPKDRKTPYTRVADKLDVTRNRGAVYRSPALQRCSGHDGYRQQLRTSYLGVGHGLGVTGVARGHPTRPRLLWRRMLRCPAVLLSHRIGRTRRREAMGSGLRHPAPRGWAAPSGTVRVLDRRARADRRRGGRGGGARRGHSRIAACG